MRESRNARARLVLTVCGVLFASATPAQNSEPASKPASGAPAATTDDSFRAFVDLVEARYLTKPSRQKLLASARDGLLADLDPYSRYLSPADWAFLHRGLEAEFGGIGVFLDFYGKRPVIKRLLADSPAGDAGIAPGDTILAIDGQTTEGLSMDDVMLLLPGKAGSTVRLRVRPAASPDDRDVEIVRRVVRTPSVRGGRQDARGLWTDYLFDPRDRIGYVRIAWMARDVPERVEKALKELSAKAMRGLILDLRNNSGGLFRAAVETADLFLDSGLIVSTLGRDGPEEAEEATPGGYLDFPMAVLVDRGTASSAEILAAALQDNGRAVLFGERTFGKALVQELFPLGDGNEGVRLTIAAYHRPSGANIDRFLASKVSATDWGVCPDTGNEVFVPVADYEASARAAEFRDRQLLPTPLELATQGPADDRDPIMERALTWLRTSNARAGAIEAASR
jgi:carboxyl-terminal processing protease